MTVFMPLDHQRTTGGARCRRARRAPARIAGEDSAPARQATNTWRLGGTPVSGTITTPAGGAVCASRGTSEIAETARDEPHHGLPVARAVRDLRAEARRRGSRRRTPRRTTSRPAARPSPRRRARRGRSERGPRAGDRTASTASSASPSSSSRWKRRVVAARRVRALHAEDEVDVAGDEQGDRLGRLGLLDPQRHRGRDRLAAAARPARADPPSAVGKPPIRTSPRGAASWAARSPSQPLELREQRVGVAEQDVRGGREPHAAPGGFEQRVAELALERGRAAARPPRA